LSHDANVKLAVFSPDNRLIATATEDDTVRLWNSLTGETIRQFPAAHAAAQDLDFSPDGQWLAVATADRVQLIDVHRREANFVALHNGPVQRAIQSSANSCSRERRSDSQTD
jgi:WD40 repeat protein